MTRTISIRIKFQFSPPELFKSVQKLNGKDVKLIPFISPLPHFMYGYKFIPKRLNINRERTSNIPIFTNSGKVIRKVKKIILIDLASLMSLKIRIIRKVLNILVEVPREPIRLNQSKTAVIVDKINKAKSN